LARSASRRKSSVRSTGKPAALAALRSWNSPSGPSPKRRSRNSTASCSWDVRSLSAKRAPRPGGYGGGGGYAGGGFGAPRPGGAYSPSRSGHTEGGAGHQRQRDFGPPAPPKDKKKPFQKKEDKPRGPIPTKFSGRMYDLDGTEDEDTIDITPDFMKHEDPDVEAVVDDKDKDKETDQEEKE
jgi:hypothetical protein